MTSQPFIVSAEDAGTRLDKYLAAQCPNLTRSRLQQLIAQGALMRDGQTLTDASRKVKQGDVYILTLPAAVPLDLQPYALALDVIYEDAHLIVINKPVGLTVHPAAGNRTHTLVNALLAHCGSTLSGIGGVERPGIVHRIDKDTSGLLVVAKTDAAHQQLSQQLKARILKRRYVTYVWGSPPVQRGKVDAPIARHPTKRREMAVVEGGRHAITHYNVEAIFTSPLLRPTGLRNGHGSGLALPPAAQSAPILATKLQCELDTGRTHQIRVHMKHIGCPLIGDATYGLSRAQTLRRIHGIIAEEDDQTLQPLLSLSRQALHAKTLVFQHPETGKPMVCEAPLPPDLVALEAALHALCAS